MLDGLDRLLIPATYQVGTGHSPQRTVRQNIIMIVSEKEFSFLIQQELIGLEGHRVSGSSGMHQYLASEQIDAIQIFSSRMIDHIFMNYDCITTPHGDLVL